MCVARPRRLRNGVVCAKDFEGPRIARCAGVSEDDVVEGRMLLAEAREANAQDHCDLWGAVRRSCRVDVVMVRV